MRVALRLAVLSVAMCACSAAHASDVVVFNAKPSVWVNSTDESTKLAVLSRREQDQNRVVITWKDGRYYWTTRENVELFYRPSGAYHCFVAANGSGYVKVEDALALPGAGRSGPRYHFIEHVSVMLWTLTYWGAADSLTLQPSP